MNNIFKTIATLKRALDEQYRTEDANTIIGCIVDELEQGYIYTAFESIEENKQASKDRIETIKSIQAQNLDEANDGYITQEHAQHQNEAWQDDITNHENIIKAFDALTVAIAELEKANLLQ